jgi:hypothetical protein
MLARFGDVWEDIYLEREGEGAEVLINDNLSDDGAMCFRDVLRKTTLEANYAGRVLPMRQK